MNNSTTILAIILALIIGHASGYFFGQRGHTAEYTREVAEMTMMMKNDGARMEKIGGMMMQMGGVVEERGTKYDDQELIMMGRDLSVSGKKHWEDGRSMMGGDMMGMTANGNMDDMKEMDMSGMDHSNM